MMIGKNAKSYKLMITVVISVLLAVLFFIGWYWKEKQTMDELGSPGLILINHTDQDVYAQVHYEMFPNPVEGAYSESGPHSGSGLNCCVSIPTLWRPGIKMIVKYRFGNWPEEKEKTTAVELPEYGQGEGGNLYLVFYNENEFELMSTMFGPHHPRWPGRRIKQRSLGKLHDDNLSCSPGPAVAIRVQSRRNSTVYSCSG